MRHILLLAAAGLALAACTRDDKPADAGAASAANSTAADAFASASQRANETAGAVGSGPTPGPTIQTPPSSIPIPSAPDLGGKPPESGSLAPPPLTPPPAAPGGDDRARIAQMVSRMASVHLPCAEATPAVRAALGRVTPQGMSVSDCTVVANASRACGGAAMVLEGLANQEPVRHVRTMLVECARADAQLALSYGRTANALGQVPTPDPAPAVQAITAGMRQMRTCEEATLASRQLTTGR